MSIIGFDKGYGLDKYAYFDKENNLKYGKMMSVFSEAPADTEEDILEFEGKKYYWGDLALMEDSSNIEDMNDYKALEKFTPLSIALLLQEEINIEPKDVTALGIGLSLAQKDYAESYLKRIQKFKVNGKSYDFRQKTFLIPQGIGAKYAIDHYFYNGEKATYAILDIGQLTIDAVKVIAACLDIALGQKTVNLKTVLPGMVFGQGGTAAQTQCDGHAVPREPIPQ